MNRTRLETFTDGVIVIAMTLMVINLVPPDGATWAELWDLRYNFLIYALSFGTLAIYWKNHHHLFQNIEKISHVALWLNVALLFFLTLFTFTTAWVDEFTAHLVPEITYGVVMFAANVCYISLVLTLARANKLRLRRGLYAATILINLVGLGLGFIYPPLVLVCCSAILILWAVPERHRV